MVLRRALLLALSAVLPLTTACGSECVSLCEEAQEDGDCWEGVDCEGYCDDVEKIAEDGKCDDELERYLSCIGEEENVCKAWTEGCFDSGYAFNNCARDYCEAKDYPAECEGFYEPG
jgi:hypothetical protein